MIIDHTALEVSDLDERIRALEQTGLKVLRHGTRYSTGQRIVMMGDGTGSKLELIEAVEHDADETAGTGKGISTRPVFAHLALRTDDADGAHQMLEAAGFRSRSAPHDLPAARARSALLDSGGGFCVQVVSYADDSPDAVTWKQDDHNPDTAITPAPTDHTPEPAGHNLDTATLATAEGG